MTTKTTKRRRYSNPATVARIIKALEAYRRAFARDCVTTPNDEAESALTNALASLEQAKELLAGQ